MKGCKNTYLHLWWCIVDIVISYVWYWVVCTSRYGELQGLNKQETADKYGKAKVQEWRRSYDIPPPNGESLEMCAERAVAYFQEHVLFQLDCVNYIL